MFKLHQRYKKIKNTSVKHYFSWFITKILIMSYLLTFDTTKNICIFEL